MKLIHTADIHLDTSYAWAAGPGVLHAPDFGRRRRQDLRAVFQAILRRAAAWPADAVLIAGDLFDLDRLRWDTVAFLREGFDLIRPIPVFITPGECDPCTPDSPYACEDWPPNVHLFRKPVWSAVELPALNAVVHGFGFDAAQPSANPLAEGLALEADGRVHVAVGHGAELGRLPERVARVMPFEAKTMDVKGLAYLALGHYHEITPVMGLRHTAMGYPGSPEGHDFDTPGAHYYLEVELPPGGAPEARPVESSRTHYQRQTVDCTGVATAEELADRLRGPLAEGAHQPLHLALTGRPAAPVDGLVRAVLARAPQRRDLVRWADETPGTAALEALTHEATSLGAFAARVARELADAPDAARRGVVRRAAALGLAAYRGEVSPLPGAEPGRDGLA